MPLFDFLCPQGHRAEHYLSRAEADSPEGEARCCEVCGGIGQRVISAPAYFSPDFAIAKNYEKRKGTEPPIRGACPDPRATSPAVRIAQ